MCVCVCECVCVCVRGTFAHNTQATLWVCR